MKVTIEPTTEEGIFGELANDTVILIAASDELDAGDALDLVKRALVAWGYHPDNLNEEA